MFRPQNDYHDNEIKIHGFNACMALWKSRPQDVIKVYVDEKIFSKMGELLKWCAQNKRAYKKVSNQELSKIAGSVHHEGLCLVTKIKKDFQFPEFLKHVKNHPEAILYLDGVDNPHNIGNIIRSAAHFGTKFILSSHFKTSTLPPVTWRIAEGGLEHVNVIEIKNAKSSLNELKKIGYKIWGTSSHNSKSIFKSQLNNKTVLILGEESQGMSEGITQICDGHLQIPGSNQIESLNVASSAAILLAETFRQIEITKNG